MLNQRQGLIQLAGAPFVLVYDAFRGKPVVDEKHHMAERGVSPLPGHSATLVEMADKG